MTFVDSFGTMNICNPRRVSLLIMKDAGAKWTMVLTDRMALGLQDRVTTFLPEFTGHAKGEVTIQHLLTHTAGLPDSVPNLHDLQKRQASVNDFFVETCRLPLLFKPGTAMSYSNLGVLVVKEIIERLTGISLRLFLKEEVFQPLSMLCGRKFFAKSASVCVFQSGKGACDDRLSANRRLRPTVSCQWCESLSANWIGSHAIRWHWQLVASLVRS